MDWYYFALTSATFSAAAAITQKKVLFKENPLEFTVLLSIFNLILALPFVFLIETSKLTTISLMVLFVKTLIEAGAFYCVMSSIKNMELSNALPLLAATPLFVALFAYIFLQESLATTAIIGIMCILIGSYTLELKKKDGLFAPIKVFIKSKGHKYIGLALLLFTISSVLDRALLKNFKVPPNSFMFFQQFFLAIIFISAALFLRKSIKKTFKLSWKIIAVISVFTIVYRYTQILATKLAPVASVLSIKRTSVFLASIIGGKLFKEHNLLRRAISAALIIIGAILLISF